ncbi:MAG: hypothetical protein AB1546_02920 [bacterium]
MEQQQKAQVAISYLPQSLVAASRGNMNVPVETELIFRETAGVSVRLDQLKRSFVISGGATIDDPVSFINILLDAGIETHQDTTLVIPANAVTLCLGGATTCNITVSLIYTGVDAQGNSITASLNVPVQITKSAAAETFAVGNVVIISPTSGQRIDVLKTRAAAKISVTGVGSVAGQWLLNGKPYKSFTKDVFGEGEITVERNLPTGLSGKNTLQLRVTQPVVKESKIISFNAVAAKPAGDVTWFRAGLFEVTRVSSKSDENGQTRSGEGIAVFIPLGLEIPVKFVALTIVDNNGSAEMSDGRIVADVNRMLERGTLKVLISQLLITADGSWIDGSVTLESSGMTPGIGPLFFYTLPLNEKGIDGEITLEKPQTGRRGDYEAAVDRFEIRFHAADAAFKVGGMMTKPSQPDWKMPLIISVSFGNEKP